LSSTFGALELIPVPLPAKPTSYTSAERKLWTMYNEEAGKFDVMMMDNWKADMDSILIFVSGEPCLLAYA